MKLNPTLLVAMLLVLAFSTTPVLATDYSSCQPFAPLTSGSHTLTQDVVHSTQFASCFDIGASNVILDCQGNSISVTNPPANGIISSSTYNNITIKNCEIIGGDNGFSAGSGGNDYSFQNNIFHNQTNSAITLTGASYNNVNITGNQIYNAISGEWAFFIPELDNLLIYDNYIEQGNSGYMFINTQPTTANYSYAMTGTNIQGDNIPASGISGNVWTSNAGTSFSDTCTPHPTYTGYCNDTYSPSGLHLDYQPLETGTIPVACTPNWECVGYDTPVCYANNTAYASCNAVNDTNACGESYTGDYSEFPDNVSACNYYEIDDCRVIDASGEYNLTQNITGDSGTLNSCLYVNTPGVTINAGDYKVQHSGSGSALYVDGSGDGFIMNDGVLFATGSEGALKLNSGSNNVLLNRTKLLSTIVNARNIRVNSGTVSNLFLDSVEISATGSGADALFLLNTLGLTIKDSSIIANDLGIDAGFGYISNSEIYGNYIQTNGRPVTYGSGSNNLFYDNVVNSSTDISGANEIYLNQSTTGNEWTNPSSNGYSDTCLNDGTGICEEPYVLGASTDYYAVAYSPYCASVWECIGYGASTCLSDDTTTASCNSVNDTNSCGRIYSGDYTEFANETGVCDYCTPSWSCDGYFNGTCIIENGTGLSSWSCNSVVDANSCYSQTLLPSDQYIGNYSEYGSGFNSCEADFYSKSAYGFGVLVTLIPVMLIVGLFMSSQVGRRWIKKNDGTTKAIGMVALLIMVILLIALL